ncbi:MAG: hypothetical protein AAGG38_13190 [Planctomycetota bacterium]
MTDKALKRIERGLDRLIGFFGGLIFAVALSLITLRIAQITEIHGGLWILASLLLAAVFSVLGAICWRYFGRFLGPVFNLFSESLDLTDSVKIFLLSIIFLLALVLLVVAPLFQTDIAFVAGCLLLSTYALVPHAALEEPTKA